MKPNKHSNNVAVSDGWDFGFMTFGDNFCADTILLTAEWPFKASMNYLPQNRGIYL